MIKEKAAYIKKTESIATFQRESLNKGFPFRVTGGFRAEDSII